jgi:hypothetical protein
MSDVARYSIPVPENTEAPKSVAEQQALSAALRQPGRVSLDSAGNVTVTEPIQVTKSTSNQERAARWRDNIETEAGERVEFAEIGKRNASSIFVYTSDGDRLPLAAARAAGLVYTDVNGRLVMQGEGNPTAPDLSASDKAQESNKPAGEQDRPVGWSSPIVDRITGIYGRELGESGMGSLVARAVTTGDLELPDHVAASFAQTIDTATPDNLKAAYSEAFAEARRAANEIIQAVGVQDIDGFVEYAESQQKNDFTEAKYKFAEGDGRGLQKLAKQYLSKFPDAGVDPDAISMIMAEGNSVNGGRLYRNEKGTAMVAFDSGQTMSLAAAIRAKYVRLSEGE